MTGCCHPRWVGSQKRQRSRRRDALPAVPLSAPGPSYPSWEYYSPLKQTAPGSDPSISIHDTRFAALRVLMRAEDLYGDLMWRSNGSAEATRGADAVPRPVSIGLAPSPKTLFPGVPLPYLRQRAAF